MARKPKGMLQATAIGIGKEAALIERPRITMADDFHKIRIIRTRLKRCKKTLIKRLILAPHFSEIKSNAM